MAELDRRLEPDDIARALLALQRRHPLLRARVEVVDGEPVFVATGGEIPLAVVPVGQGEPIPYAALLGWTFGPAPDPLARCVYLPVENEDRSALVLMVDHTIIDGSTCHVLLRQLVQGLERPTPSGPRRTWRRHRCTSGFRRRCARQAPSSMCWRPSGPSGRVVRSRPVFPFMRAT
jgi:hypothetical protein